MALNVTTAVFRPGFNIATASPSLVQWDQGQTLQFEGVELPSAYQVEFTNAVTVQAITMIGNENGVEIPNELLQQSFPINAYIVLHETAEDRETEYWATIYVKARQQPREETPDPEQISVIDQTIAALQEGVAEAQAASQAVQNMGVEAETLPEGSEATVEKTVDPETGEVTLEFGIPEGRHGATGATPDIQIGTVITGAPGSQADASITGTREEPRLNLTIPQGPQGDAGVTSVNGKTGAVTLDATDVGAKPASYEAPVSSVNGKTGAVVLDASDVGAKPASYEAPVSSVNGKTGAVVLSASDVGAKPASYEAPVSSVNEKTGAVVLDSEDIRYDSTETYSDGTVGKELGTINSALSSLSSVTEIIDTASGAIASFPDGSGLPMRSLVAQINPIQDLHGQDAPWPAGGGKNILPTPAQETQTVNGITVKTNTDGSITFSGTASDAASINFVFFDLSQGDYILSNVGSNATSSGATSSIYVKDNTHGETLTSFGLGNSVSGNAFTLTETVNIRFYAVIQAGATVSGTLYPMIRRSGDGDNSYTPYSNECPITGWTGLSGQRTGANLFDKTTITDNAYVNGAGVVTSNTEFFCSDYISVKPETSYYIYTDINGRMDTIRFYDANKAVIGGSAYQKRVVTAPANCHYIRINAIKSHVSADEVFFNYPSTDASYHAYQGEAISASWQDTAGTVYGGTLDVVSGLLTVDRFEYSFTGNETFITNSVWGQYAFLYNAGTEVASSYQTQDYCKSSHFKVLNAASWGDLIPNYFMVAGSTYIGLGFDGTTEELKSWLASQANDNNPVQVICMLKTPQTYQLTPQQVSTLLGQNNVWADTGDVSVTYQASIKGYIDKVLAS